MATSGKLEVTIVEARLTQDKETFSTQDPYVMIEHRMQRFKSKVSNNGGKEPKFDEKFIFDVKYIGDDFTMRIMNKNSLMSDDTLGDATIKVSGLCVPGGMDDWWKVYYKGNHGGSIRFNCLWHPARSEADDQLEEKEAQLEALKANNMQAQMQQQQNQYNMQLQAAQQMQAQQAAAMAQQQRMQQMQYQQQMAAQQQAMAYAQAPQQMHYQNQMQQQYQMQQPGYGQQMGYQQPQGYGYQQPMYQQQQQQAHCPHCRQALIPDPNSVNLEDISCNGCNAETNKVLSCRPCDFDLCYNCVPKFP